MDRRIHPKEYLLRVITKIGSASSKQLQEICKPVMSRSVLYYHLKGLVGLRLVERVTHPNELKFAYRATDEAFANFYEFDEKSGFGRPRACELSHTLSVTEAIITLSKYQNVTGYTPEHALCPSRLREATGYRRPDAIIELTNTHGVYSLAVEVENSLKSKKRIQGILEAYEHCFEADRECVGVIIICEKKTVLDCYLEHLGKMDEEFRKRVLLLEPKGLLTLRESIYGAFGTRVGKIWDLGRTKSTEET